MELDAPTGTYLKGALKTGGGRFNLDLVGKDGTHERQIFADIEGDGEFHVMIEKDGSRLQLTSRGKATEARLEILMAVTSEDQRPPAKDYTSPTMAALAADVAAGKSTDAFWEKMTASGTPLVEERPDGSYVATFLWRGARKNVRLFGAPSGDHENLERLGQSDIWYKSFIVPAETRISYKLAPDVPDVPGTARERRVAILATAQADPLNPKRWPADAPDRFNADSTLVLPKAPAQPYLVDRSTPKGDLSTFRLKSALLGNERDIKLYKPVGFDPKNPRNVLLFVFDGLEFATKARLPLALDNMMADGVVPPVVTVFVTNAGRDTRGVELPGNPDFADFMATELLPKVLAETGMAHDASRTVLAGVSFGGLASSTVALRHPEAFGNVLSMSGSYWWSPPGTPEDSREYVARQVAEMPANKLRFFLMAGLFEGGSSRGVASILNTNRHLRDMLLARNNQVYYREYAGGHDYFVWQGAISDGLIALFGN